MKAIYIAGPYRGEPYEVEQHCHAAWKASLKVIEQGNAPFSPHSQFRHMDGAHDQERFMDCCLEMLTRCDEMLVLPGWKNSEGTKIEINCAKNMGMKIIYCDEL